MNELADSQPRLIDLRHLGRERVIGSWRVGDVLVDPGPGSCLDTLLASLGDEPLRAVALTHIHLDHAGATGALVQRFPEIEVWVHERGAPHMVDPSRLMASAGRLYGEHMQRLWGEMLPVPAERVRALAGGERLGPFRVAYTPGHASHHVAYLHEDSGRAYTGDVAGVRIGGGHVIPPTPPPDIDLVAWRASLDQIERWAPTSLALTHFGVYEDVAEHLAAMRVHLDEVEAMARDMDERSFAAAMRALMAATTDADTRATYEQATVFEQNFQGLVRYLRKRMQTG